MDLGCVVFHAFTDEGRAYFDLEGQWNDAQRAYVEKGLRYEQYLRSKGYSYRTGDE